MNWDRTSGEDKKEVEEDDPLVLLLRCRKTEPVDLLAATSAALSL